MTANEGSAAMGSARIERIERARGVPSYTDGLQEGSKVESTGMREDILHISLDWVSSS
jgi:hypothetical protein